MHDSLLSTLPALMTHNRRISQHIILVVWRNLLCCATFKELLLTKSSKPISGATTLKIVGTGAFMLHGFAAAIKRVAKEGLILSVK